MGNRAVITTKDEKSEIELLEEISILRNPEMMKSIKESDVAKKKGVKTWEIHPFL